MLDHVTTAVQSPFSYASDPSGAELRKALLRADCDVVWVEPANAGPVRTDPAQPALAVVAGPTLMGGVARVAVS